MNRSLVTDGLSHEELRSELLKLKTGDTLLLSGTVYTARDAAHKKIAALLKSGLPLPFPVQDAFLYYAGPTPTKPGLTVGSFGPTTSSRMDPYTPTLYDLGLAATIGKGERKEEVRLSCKKNGSIYLCAIGGAGALAAKHITSCEVIAFEELGCESVKKLRFDEFPLTVAIDSEGTDIFERNGKSNE